MKIYIATGLKNVARYNEARTLLERCGCSITYDWTTHGAVQSEGRDRLIEIAECETRGVLDADAVVALLPGGRGTHTEIGIALGAGKRVFVVGTDDYSGRAFSVGALREGAPRGALDPSPKGDTVAFYWHPSVTVVPSLPDLPVALFGHAPRGLDVLMAEIIAWQHATFPQATPASAVEHLRREANELHRHYWKSIGVSSRVPTDDVDDNKVAEELADVFFLTVAVAMRAGIDLTAAVAAKFEKNKARKWGRPDERGVVEHIRDDEAAA